MRKFLLALSLFAFTSVVNAMSYYLIDQWYGSNGQMCEYSNGTILNVGSKLCPLSIRG